MVALEFETRACDFVFSLIPLYYFALKNMQETKGILIHAQ